MLLRYLDVKLLLFERHCETKSQQATYFQGGGSDSGKEKSKIYNILVALVFRVLIL